MFLCIVAKIQNQSKCLERDKWIHKIWHTDTVGYYSTIEKNRVLHLQKWMEVEIIMSNEISLKDRRALYIQPYMG